MFVGDRGEGNGLCGESYGIWGLEGMIGFADDKKQFNESLQSRQRPAKLGNYNNRSIDSFIHSFIHSFNQ